MSSAEFAALHLVCLGGLAGGFDFDCFVVGGLADPFAGILSLKVIGGIFSWSDMDKYLETE
jgi:hypothetical protein